MRAILGAVLVLALAGGTTADEKEDKKDEKIDGTKLFGKWELVKPALAGKLTAEYRGDENLVITVEFGESTQTTLGSFKLDGNKLTQALKGPEGEEKRFLTITRVNDGVLEYESSGGVTFSFKRVKDKDKDKK